MDNSSLIPPTATAVPITVAATRDDILACQFHQWIHLFSKETMKSKVIPLSKNFISYLLQDGVILPTIPGVDPFGKDELSDDEDLFEPVENNNEDMCPYESIDDFHQLTADITQAINDLKGEVFVKLNWSAPTDASWLKGGSLKCLNATDVYLLLKSSDRIVYDIEHMFDQCPPPVVDVDDDDDHVPEGEHPLKNTIVLNIDIHCFCSCHTHLLTNLHFILHSFLYTASNSDLNELALSSHPSINYHLILRKWANLNPAMEFRLFVGNKSILGICQRDCSSYYDFLSNEMDDLEDLMVAFWTTKVGIHTITSPSSPLITITTT